MLAESKLSPGACAHLYWAAFPVNGDWGFYDVFVVGFSPKNREAALITLPILQGFVKNSVIRISPGCAGSISLRSHLLIVVRRGRGWKTYLGFWIASTVSRPHLSALLIVYC